jgi:hypothetical protein
VTLLRFPEPMLPVESFIGVVAEADPINPAEVTAPGAAALVRPTRLGTDPFGRSDSFS